MGLRHRARKNPVFWQCSTEQGQRPILRHRQHRPIRSKLLMQSQRLLARQEQALPVQRPRRALVLAERLA